MPPTRNYDSDSSLCSSSDGGEDASWESSKMKFRPRRTRPTKKTRRSEPFPVSVHDKANNVLLTRRPRCASNDSSPYARAPRSCSSVRSESSSPSSEATKIDISPSKIKPSPKPFSEPITVSGINLRPTIAFDTFWRFAAERKVIDDRRRAGQCAPWTEDKILQNYFFCNTFRVLDKGCQFLIKEVIEKGSQNPEEVVFRVVLFNLFTKIKTWELLDRKLGPLTWSKYNREAYRKVLETAANQGVTLYTGAFIKPAPDYGYEQNCSNHLCFLESLMEQQLFSRLLNAPYMADVYEYIISFPAMGPFTTYQLILNLSYTKVLNFNRNDLVISGPGSISGLNKIFDKKSMDEGRAEDPGFEAEVMRYMTKTQDYHFARLGLHFSGLGPEKLPMDIADIEHTLCEVDKYCRVAHPQLKGKRTNITRYFKSDSSVSPTPSRAVLPKAWSDPARRKSRIRPNKVLEIHKRYRIASLRDHRDDPDGRKYHVYWEGYPASMATWEFESSLVEDAPDVVDEYRSKFNI